MGIGFNLWVDIPDKQRPGCMEVVRGGLLKPGRLAPPVSARKPN